METEQNRERNASPSQKEQPWISIEQAAIVYSAMSILAIRTSALSAGQYALRSHLLAGQTHALLRGLDNAFTVQHLLSFIVCGSLPIIMLSTHKGVSVSKLGMFLRWLIVIYLITGTIVCSYWTLKIVYKLVMLVME